MGLILLIFAASLYQIMKYFNLSYVIHKSIFHRIIFHLIEIILVIISLYLMYEEEFNIYFALLIIIFIVLPASIAQLAYDKKN